MPFDGTMTFVSMTPGRNIRTAAVALLIFFFLSLVYFWHDGGLLPDDALVPVQAPPPVEDAPATQPSPAGQPLIEDVAQYFIDYPLQPPYKDVFGEMGRRTRFLGDWIVQLEASGPAAKAHDAKLVEQVAKSLFPFIDNKPTNPNSTTPLADLRSSFAKGSAGIVIPTGDNTVRFAGHLVVALRSVLQTVLPIQIVYAGDFDLSPANRKLLASLVEKTGPPLEFYDVNFFLDNSALKFSTSPSGGWAVKAFAALVTRFEKVIILDADAVFLQPPEILFLQPSFKRTGAFLFHDRLLWQGRFQDRHTWWKDQIRRPSATLNKSRVWTEDYAEECDSGVVILDKSRVDVLMGLLHTCWQNSYEVREEITYKITYGDKETWWMGLELAGSPYEMGKHYGGIVGWEAVEDDGRHKVCSFVIAHVDETDKLLWYNGGLLKNKKVNATEYLLPEKWMFDGDWQKGAASQDISCMINGEMQSLTPDEVSVLQRSIEKAKWVDTKFKL